MKMEMMKLTKNANTNRTYVQDGYQPRTIPRGYQPTVSQTTPKATPKPPTKSGGPHKK